MLPEYKYRIEKKLGFVLKLLKSLGLKPNDVTSIGLIFGILGSIIIFYNLVYGLICFIFSFLFDLFDGALSRTYKMETKFGAFYDSFTDRVVEVLFIGTITIITKHEAYGMFMIGLSALISYSKHRADTLVKEKINSSLFDRPERIIYLVLAFLCFIAGKDIVLWYQIFIVLTIAALVQIVVKVWKSAK